ncbi:hypothetical protein ACFL0O_08645 [Thermodesulfobacteriota bacterium]
MKKQRYSGFLVLAAEMMAIGITACTQEPPINVTAITSQPKAFVGSDTCKMCHLEHYVSAGSRATNTWLRISPDSALFAILGM